MPRPLAARGMGDLCAVAYQSCILVYQRSGPDLGEPAPCAVIASRRANLMRRRLGLLLNKEARNAGTCCHRVCLKVSLHHLGAWPHKITPLPVLRRACIWRSMLSSCRSGGTPLSATCFRNSRIVNTLAPGGSWGLLAAWAEKPGLPAWPWSYEREAAASWAQSGALPST